MDTSTHVRADEGSQARAGLEDTLAEPANRPVAHVTCPPMNATAHWHELLAQVGRELAEPLTAALERVTTLTTTGRLDRAGLLALRHEVDQARQVGLRSQQMARLACGGIRSAHETIDVAALWRDVVHDRARDLRARRIQLSSTLAPTEVRADASMLFAMLHAWIDWLIGSATGQASFELSTTPTSHAAQMVCRFTTEIPMAAEEAATAHHLNSLSWFLLTQTAQILNADLSRRWDAKQVCVTLLLPP